MKLMKTFRVLSGKHYEKGPKGKVILYRKGDEFTSPKDLRSMFANKFELVAEKETSPKPTLKPSSVLKPKTQAKMEDAVNADPLADFAAE